MDILYEFGGYSPVILILLSWYLLWEHKNLFFYYNVGLISNAVLNIILKGLIQEPRPMFDNKKIHLKLLYIFAIVYKFAIYSDSYLLVSRVILFN
jgi:hypothetical protein